MINSLERGATFELNGQLFEIDRVDFRRQRIETTNLINDNLHVIDIEVATKKLRTGMLRVVSQGNDRNVSEYEEALGSEHDPAVADRKTALMTDSERIFAERRLGYVRAISIPGFRQLIPGIAAQKNAITEHALTIDDQSPPSRATVARWFARYRAGQHRLVSLLRKTRAVNRKSKTEHELRMDAKNAELFDHALNKYFLKQTRTTVKELRLRMLQLVQDVPAFGECRVPSESTLYRKIKALPNYLVIAKQRGWGAANRQFPNGHPVQEPTYLLESVELDHTQLDICVVDDVNREPIGNPWITVLIDRLSRMIIGFHISMAKPCRRSVLLAVKHAVYEKNHADFAQQHPSDEIDLNPTNEWPCCGNADQIITDNGADLFAEQTREALAEISDVIYLPGGSPQLKGRIERVLGTLNRKVCHTRDGTSFENYQKKGDYNAQKEALYTLNTIARMVYEWIVDEYHVSVHRALGTTPLQKWQEESTVYRRLDFPDPGFFERQLYQKIRRKLQKYGVECNSLRYNSPQLMEMAKQHGFGIDVDVLIDEANIGSIEVATPDSKDTVTAYCELQSYVRDGLSLQEHKEIRRKAREANSHGAVTEQELIEKRRASDAALQKSAEAKNSAERRRAAKKKAQHRDASENSGSLKSSKCHSRTKSKHLDLSKTKALEVA